MTFDRYYRTLHAALTEIVRQHFDAPNPHLGMGKFAQAATAAYSRRTNRGSLAKHRPNPRAVGTRDYRCIRLPNRNVVLEGEHREKAAYAFTYILPITNGNFDSEVVSVV